MPPQQRVRRFNASNPSANGQQPAKQVWVTLTLTLTLILTLTLTLALTLILTLSLYPKQPALNGRVTPTLGAMAVGGLQQQRVQALG